MSPSVEGTDIAANEAWLGRNKRNIFLNLKHPKAIAIVKQLIQEYDIVIEQFRPGVMEKLGLGYEALKAVNPALIYCSLTGYGQTGPMAKAAGHDCNYLARSGNLAMAGYRDAGPAPMNIQIADICVGSMNSVVGILAAVQYRNRTGKGQYIDVAMLDGLVPFTAMDGTRFLATGEDCGRSPAVSTAVPCTATTRPRTANISASAPWNPSSGRPSAPASAVPTSLKAP